MFGSHSTQLTRIASCVFRSYTKPLSLLRGILPLATLGHVERLIRDKNPGLDTQLGTAYLTPAGNGLFIGTFSRSRSLPSCLRLPTRIARLTTHLTMKRNISPAEVGAPDVSDTRSDKKQRTTRSDPPTPPREIPPQPMNQDSANTDSAGLEATTSVTDEDSAASEPECSSADEEKNESDQEDLSYLCNRCREIDFDSIFSRQNIENGDDLILWFYSEHKVLDDPQCAFCRAMQFIHPSLDMLPDWKKRETPLVVAVFQNNLDARPTYENGWDVTEGEMCLTFGRRYQNPRISLHTTYLWTKKNGEHRSFLTDERVGYLAEERSIERDKSALPAASIKPRVNFGMVQAWLRECRKQHRKCRSKRGEYIQKVPGMRLIDCRTRTVVPAPEGEVSYAALSYVWGNSGGGGVVEDGCDHKLPDILPNTISDAILATRKLKMRYLWIDRYCIRQNAQTKEEQEEKHGQIAQMHHIYGGSSMTIIAAAGDGPHHGLPGVRTKRRSHPIVRLPHRTVFATLPNPKLLVDTSAWSTRGWTFQEGLLARRRLVFTDQQVYFECGSVGIAEALEEYHKFGMCRGGDVNQNTPLHSSFDLGNGGGPSVWPRISHYVNLTLRDPQDILNGILGVLTHYEEISSMRHVAGLPISPWTPPDTPWESALVSWRSTPISSTSTPISWAEDLADALSWECDDHGERRAGFPTWSWTGWTCKGFERNDKFNRIPPNRVRAWSISVERLEDVSADQSDLVALLEGRHDLSRVKFLRVTAPFLETEIISMDGIPKVQHYLASKHFYPRYGARWSSDGFDNNEKTLGVRYLGVEEVSFINLTDSNLLKLPLPGGKIQCTAIIMDEDRSDPSNYRLGKERYPVRSSTRYYATALLLVEKENGFEKVGVSCIDRQTLRRIGSVVGEFTLI